jgi:hypothetical protein
LGADARGRAALIGVVALVTLAGACGMRGGAVLRARSTVSGPDGAADGSTDVTPIDATTPPPDAGPGEVPMVPLTTVYLSPAGADTNPGTADAPWKTFAYALSLLRPGMTLVLLDGTYDAPSTGYLRAYCAPVMGTGAMANVVVTPANAMSGTTDQPVTVRAQNERRAFLKGDGGGPAVLLSGCQNWVLDGLRAEGVDLAGEKGDEPGSVVVLTRSCTNVLLRRLLAARPNRYMDASVYVIGHAGPGVVVEECEAVDFHYYGFHAFDSQHPIFRRSHAHSRDVADLAGGFTTAHPSLGDGGFLLTKSRSGLIENCVAEHVGDGFTIAGSRTAMNGRVQPQFNQVFGSIAMDTTRAGFVVASHCGNTKPCDMGDQLVSDPLFSNDVVSGGAMGFLSTGGVRVQIENGSIFGVTNVGVLFSIDAENAGLTSSAFARATQVSASSPVGFRSQGHVDWSFARCNAFGPTQSFVPRDGHVDDPTEVDPQLGGCLVTVPAGSPLRAAAPGGAGVGANIVYRFDDGQLTPTKLWDQATGQFPCGATVPGVNDRADVSCTGIHTRARVGTGACAIP